MVAREPPQPYTPARARRKSKGPRVLLWCGGVSDAASEQQPSRGARGGHADHGIAMRNAVIVSGSLVVTWSVALLIRLILPRSLGPDLFGQYSFADALAANGFGFIGFGIDTYIQKEIPHRPEHASDFFGGVQLLRLLASSLVLAVTAMLARAGNYSFDVVATVLVFGVSQLFITFAASCASLLYASRRVGRLSLLNIVCKLLWAGVVGAALQQHAPLWAFAAAAAVSEGVRLVVLFRLSRHVLGLRLQLHLAQTAAALRSSAPFYLTQIGVALYAKIDVAIMGMLLPDREVGFYSAATNISIIAMLMAPLMGWVLTPQIARAAPDPAEFKALMRRSLEWTLAVAVPLGLALGLGADVIMHVVYGPRFDPAINAMRALAPMFVAVYVSMLCSLGLMMTGRAWTVTKITVLSFLVNGTMNALLLRPALRAFGEGGAGIAAASIWVGTELMVALIYVGLLGRDVLDRRNVVAFAKSLVTSVCVVTVHIAAARLGNLRLALDLVVYLALILGSGAVRIKDLSGLVDFARTNLRRRAGAVGGGPTGRGPE